MLRKFAVPPRPRSTAFLPDGSRAYVTCENGHSVAVVDAREHSLLRTIALTGENARPMGAWPSPDGRFVYVTTGRGRRSPSSTPPPTRPWLDRGGPAAVGHRDLRGRRHPVHRQRPFERRLDRRRRDARVTARIKVGDSPWGLVTAGFPQ